jgi:hypothetical protein
VAATSWICAIALAGGLAVAGCSASLPGPVVGEAGVGPGAASGQDAIAPEQIDGRQTAGLVAPSGTPAPTSPSPAGSATAGVPIGSADGSRSRATANVGAGCTRCRITAFKPQIVTLFMSEAGQDGQRVPKAALPVPVVATSTDPTRTRLAIMTMDGQRWVSSADVVTEQLP